MPDAGVEVSVTTDKKNYPPDEPIVIRLEVTNRTDEVITFEFANGQRHDFEITSETGKLLWRWSDGMGFIQALGQETLGPSESLSYTERYEGELRPGRYTITGKLVAISHALSATTHITVR